MTSIINKLIIALLFSANFLFADLFKITLNYGDVFNNCKNLKIEDDSLYISLLINDSLNKMIHIEKIKSIVKMSNSFITKYDFTDMSRIQKIKTLKEIVEPDIHRSTSPIPIIPKLFSDRNLYIILTSLTVIILMSISTVLIIRLRKKKRPDEKVRGAKEMVKTMIYWAKRHRDEISKY